MVRFKGRTVNKEKFKELFFAALEQSVTSAEERLNRNLPHHHEIKLYWHNFDNERLDADTAGDLLYLGDNAFFEVVDIGAMAANSTVTQHFVRPSGHEPVSSISKTWGGIEKGPFKQVIFVNFAALADDE
jgi:hypothetical protein